MSDFRFHRGKLCPNFLVRKGRTMSDFRFMGGKLCLVSLSFPLPAFGWNSYSSIPTPPMSALSLMRGVGIEARGTYIAVWGATSAR